MLDTTGISVPKETRGIACTHILVANEIFHRITGACINTRIVECLF